MLRLAFVFSASLLAEASLVGSVIVSICVVGVRTHSARHYASPITDIGYRKWKKRRKLTKPSESGLVGG